jgi:hypothetical protein
MLLSGTTLDLRVLHPRMQLGRWLPFTGSAGEHTGEESRRDFVDTWSGSILKEPT